MTPETRRRRLELEVLLAAVKLRQATPGSGQDLRLHITFEQKVWELAEQDGGLGSLCANLEQALGEQREPKPQLQWYARTWVDVRPGDRIRMSGVEARVLSVTPLDWHVHPATGTSGSNPPVAREHTLISYRLAAPYDKQLYQIQPIAPVEIQADVHEISAWLDGEPIGTVEDYWRDRRGVKNS